MILQIVAFGGTLCSIWLVRDTACNIHARLERCKVAVLPLQPQVHLPVPGFDGVHNLSIVFGLPDV